MRILASGKRDSVTGEDVDIALAQVVSSTGQYSGSRNSSVSLGLGTTGIVDSGKLLTDHVVSPPSVKKSTHTRSSRIKSRTKESVSRTVKFSAAVWKCRVGKSVSNFIDIVSIQYCCAGNKRSEERYHKNDKKAGCPVTSKQETKFSAKKVSKEKVGDCHRTIEIKQTGIGEGTFTRQLKVSRKNINHINKRSLVLPSDNLDVTIATNSTGLLAATGTANIKTMRGGIYHEKQVKSLCALHALNNLLQDGKAFQQEDLDKICSELDPNSWVNPHKSVFGLGNYDINVIMTALQQKKLEAIWFDKRKDPSEELNFENIYGFILNIPSDCRLGWLALPIKRKHWVAIRNLPSPNERNAGRNNYYNLDSKFDKPESIGSTENLIDYLRSELKSPEKELFLVVTEDVGRVEIWRKNPPTISSAASSSSSAATAASSCAINTNLLPVPNASGDGLDASAGSGTNRRTSNDSGVVDLLPDLRDINVVDLNREELMRRQSSGVWSDMT